MDTLRATYKDDDDENSSKNTDNDISETLTPAAVPSTTAATPDTSIDPTSDIKEEPLGSEDLSDFENHQEIGKDESKGSPNFAKFSEEGEDEEEIPPAKRQKQLSSFASEAETEEVVLVTTPPRPISKTIRTTIASTSTTVAKKSKKKSNANNVWTKPTSRKGKKKLKNNSKTTPDVQKEDLVRITPMPRLPDKNDDNTDMKICLSRTFKAEKVELSEDRLSAGSCKGYRMVRATRGVMEGAWYFEIKVVKLGETGHTRLGWSTDKGDLQAPVGYDGNSFGYRDIDGSKIHKALREKYGEEGYAEGDVIGFYINLPEGDLYAPKPPRLVWFKGQRYACAPDAKEDPPKIIPGSEVSIFKNGICQGVAFTNINGGRYYPAASMYTLPNQPNCMVTFNFGPDFESFPADFGGRPLPKPMSEVPYHGSDIITETGKPWVSTRMCSMLKLVEEKDNKNMED